MKAIVSIMQTSHGESVQLLGIGDDESEARLAAYETINHGHNPFDIEYGRGTLIERHTQLGRLVDVSARLAALHKAADFIDEYDNDGNLVGGGANDAHMELMDALGRLCLRRGYLDYRDPELTA